MQIDSTPLDVLVLLDDGVVGPGRADRDDRRRDPDGHRGGAAADDQVGGRARAAGPDGDAGADAAGLGARRCGCPARCCRTGGCWRIDERLEHAAARPVIVPETIVCDHGKVFISRNFRASCRLPGHQLPARPPGHADGESRTSSGCSARSGTLFAQFVAGYVGSQRRTPRPRTSRQQPLWSMLELQDLLDEWIVAAWQNRPHDGLRDPVTPGRAFTPNEKYAALVEAAGYVPVALSADDYIELLPARWRAINAYGIKINHRTYDADDAQPAAPAAVRGRRPSKNLWEVHHDPYDVSRIWVRDHRDGGWITVFWKHLRPRRRSRSANWPGTTSARRPARRPPRTEIADAVAALLATRPPRPGRRPEAAPSQAGPAGRRPHQGHRAGPAGPSRTSEPARRPADRTRTQADRTRRWRR